MASRSPRSGCSCACISSSFPDRELPAGRSRPCSPRGHRGPAVAGSWRGWRLWFLPCPTGASGREDAVCRVGRGAAGDPSAGNAEGEHAGRHQLSLAAGGPVTAISWCGADVSSLRLSSLEGRQRRGGDSPFCLSSRCGLWAVLGSISPPPHLRLFPQRCPRWGHLHLGLQTPVWGSYSDGHTSPGAPPFLQKEAQLRSSAPVAAVSWSS